VQVGGSGGKGVVHALGKQRQVRLRRSHVVQRRCRVGLRQRRVQGSGHLLGVPPQLLRARRVACRLVRHAQLRGQVARRLLRPRCRLTCALPRQRRGAVQRVQRRRAHAGAHCGGVACHRRRARRLLARRQVLEPQRVRRRCPSQQPS